jgi:acyl-CoA synthetase (AMP-forming)/AMP-acid ligase II
VLIGDILSYNALNWPDRVALVAGERRISFAELQASAWRLANALVPLCRPGDRSPFWPGMCPSMWMCEARAREAETSTGGEMA